MLLWFFKKKMTVKRKTLSPPFMASTNTRVLMVLVSKTMLA